MNEGNNSYDYLEDFENLTELNYFDEEANSKSKEFDSLLLHQYLVLGWLGLIINIIGILGNSFTVKILASFKTKSSTIVFMTALAVSDLVQLILILFLLPLRYLLVSHHSVRYHEIHTRLYPYIYPITTIVQFTSIYLIVVTCISRVVQLYKPNISFKVNKPKSYKIIVYIILFSVVSCMPLWFYYDVYYERENNSNKVKIFLKYSDISFDSNFRYYLHVYLIVITYVIPLLILLVTSYLLVKFLMKSRLRKQILGLRERNEFKVTFVLILFVALFFLCQFPNFVLHVLQAHSLQLRPILQSYLHQWANILLIVNSSLNFVYYFFLYDFRQKTKSFFSGNKANSVSVPRRRNATGNIQIIEGVPMQTIQI